MGIHLLMTLLRSKAPNCINQFTIDHFKGRVIGYDASMAMYQFLIQTQGFKGSQITQITDRSGNKTAHLIGLFNRTISYMEHGIHPVWVFDGKPPEIKGLQLAKRKQAKQEAKVKSEEALRNGNMEEALLQSQRTMSISSIMREDAIKMLELMGCPVIQAPCEAEAQCAALCRSGLIYATATEDMDALTFQTPILLKDFNTKKEPIYEINHDEMLRDLDLTQPQFVDLCILCGCDYTQKIGGIGQSNAFKLIQKHKNIETVLANLNYEKYILPENFYYQQSRDMFMNHQVIDPSTINLNWSDPKEDQLKSFLVGQKGFQESRIDNGLKKIQRRNKSKNKETDWV